MSVIVEKDILKVTNKKVILTATQITKLNELWFIYGNGRRKSTLSNHKFIQDLLERDEDCRELYNPTIECAEEVDKVLNE